MINNESSYKYDVKSIYKESNHFKVELTNKTNDNKQIILRNKDGVYVVTPSLKKSFKFQSDWPYNNSQIYLLQSIVQDIKNDKNLDSLFIKAEAYINNEVYNILNIDKLVNDDRLYIDNSN